MKIAITGHRPSRLKGQEKRIKEWFKHQFKKYSPDVVYIGMAQGVDQIAGIVAKDMGIPLVCCYPFPKSNYHAVELALMENNEVLYINEQGSRKAYADRDRFMVDSADMVLCVWDGLPGGGTWLTKEYAKKKNVPIIEYEGLKK